MASSPTQNIVDVMFLCHGYEGEAARDFVGAVRSAGYLAAPFIVGGGCFLIHDPPTLISFAASIMARMILS